MNTPHRPLQRRLVDEQQQRFPSTVTTFPTLENNRDIVVVVAVAEDVIQMRHSQLMDS